MRKALLLLLSLLLAGCASSTTIATGANSTAGSPNPGSSVPVTTVPGTSPPTTSATCPATVGEPGSAAPGSTPVTSAVAVSWVLRCVVVTKAGARSLLTERSDSDATALVTALRTPSGLQIKGVCPMYRPAVPYFALVQADGQAFVPKVPVTNCGQAQPKVLSALNGLKFTVLSTKALK